MLIEAIYHPLIHSVFILLDFIPMIKRPQFEARKQPISPRIPPGPSWRECASTDEYSSPLAMYHPGHWVPPSDGSLHTTRVPPVGEADCAHGTAVSWILFNSNNCTQWQMHVSILNLDILVPRPCCWSFVHCFCALLQHSINFGGVEKNSSSAIEVFVES